MSLVYEDYVKLLVLKETEETTISNGESITAAIDLGRLHTLLAIQMPAAWTAAVITLQASADGATWADLYKSDGTEYQLTVDASQFIILDPSDMAPIRYLKIRSGTSASPQAQGADRVLTLTKRPV